MRFSLPTRSRRFAPWLLLFAFCLLPFAASPGLAQVPSRSALTNPAPGVTNLLGDWQRGPARVVLYNSPVAAGDVPAEGLSPSVRAWELLLLRFRLPYSVVGPRDLARGLPEAAEVLVLPDAEILSEKQLNTIAGFLLEGGGLIATGRTGVLDNRGQPQAEAVYEALFGAEVQQSLPNDPVGVFQVLEGGTPLTDGLPAGFRLNLRPQKTPLAARASFEKTRALGFPQRYTQQSSEADPFEGFTFALYGESGAGRFVWTRFGPEDVATDAQTQAVYAGFVANSLAYAGRVPSASVRTWPGGADAALSVAILPSDSGLWLSSAKRTAEVLAREDVRATYFVNPLRTDELGAAYRQLAQQGELAIDGSAYGLFERQPQYEQARRLRAARARLGALTEAPVVGFRPTGNRYDAATLSAMREAGLGYLLGEQTERLAVPTLDATVRTDFRTQLDTGDLLFFPRTGRDSYEVIVRDEFDEEDPQRAAYLRDLERLFDLGGVYVLQLFPDLQASDAQRAEVVADLVAYAKAQDAWIAPLGEVQAWWGTSRQVKVGLVQDGDQLDVVIVNPTGKPIEGFSLDLRLGFPVRGGSVLLGDLELRSTTEHPGTVTMIFESLPPGTRKARILLNSLRLDVAE